MKAPSYIKLADCVTGGSKPSDRYSYSGHRENVQAYMRALNRMDARDPATRVTIEPALSPIVKVIFEYPCFYQGWECDEWGWVVERADGTHCLVETSHGSAYVCKPESLSEAIAKYEDAVTRTHQALALVGGAQ